MNTFLNPNAIADGSITAPKLEGGEYPKITSGFAKDLTGRIEATPEEFTYRPSAGDKSVRDESAVIRRIKGNSVIFSQSMGYIKNSEYKGVSITHNNNGVVELSGVLSDGTTVQTGYLANVFGHRYLIVMEVLSMGDAISFNGGNLNIANFTFNEAGKNWTIKNTTRTQSISYIGFYNISGSANGVKYRYQQFDLTEMFGAGNEPTTYDEFRQYYPDDYYPYCAPVVRSMRATAIETIGFNAFNGEYAEVIGGQTYYLGGTINTAHFATEIGGEMTEITISENRLYTPSTNGYIYATGNDICINLSHSGVRNGEYEEYEKNTLLLPEIAKYFPDGMHGIGDVCDEIIDGLAIQRCAVRAYKVGDENDVEVKTNKITNTVYKLSEPIYTPIDEPLQLDYKVDDFGTEKMLTDKLSAPFKADITYGFNAEGRIRDNSRNIERLENNIIDIRDGADKGKTSVQSITINGESKTPDENGVVDLGRIYVTTLAYTATSKVENTEYPWSDDTFGAPIISHEYDGATGVGVIYFSDRITTIGYAAFRYCDSLTSVTIPDSVTTIGERAFYNCYSLTSVTIPDSVTTIGSNAFIGCTGKLVVNCNIPSASSSSYGAFYGSEFTSVTIGDAVTTIGDYAFYNCNSITSVTIGNSVTSIGKYTFYGCSGITSVTIGDSVTKIGTYAFATCSNLTSVYCKAITPPVGGSSMFYNIASGRKIYVPAESVDAYKSATIWSDYADKIVAAIENIPAASTSNYGVTKLSSLTNSTSTTLAATPKAVKSAYDLANDKYSKPADGIPSTDLSESVNEALSLAQSAIQKSDIEYAVVASFTIDDINTSTLNNIDIERTDESNFIKRKPLMIKKNANSDALYPLTYARTGDPNSMSYSYICTCTVEDVTYEFIIYYIAAQTQKGKILNIHKYGDCYVVDFTLENLNTIATSQIEINVTKLYDVIRNHQPIIIKNLTADYGGVLVSGWIENLDDGETAHINLNIPTSTGFWKINGLVFDKTNQEQQTYTMTGSNVTKYSLPRLSSGSEDYLIAKTNLKTINNTNIYINSSTEPTNIYTYYPVISTARASETILPNTFYKFGNPTRPVTGSISIELGSEISDVVNEYIFEIYTTTVVPTLDLPDTIKWVSGDAPVLEENKIYQISIINNLGTVLSWDNA